jgi:hypothetical protein
MLCRIVSSSQRKSQGVADLVQRGVAPVARRQVPPEVHGAPRPAGPIVDRVAADVGPGTCAALKADSNLGLFGVPYLFEFKTDPEILPLLESVSHGLFLVAASPPLIVLREEQVMQDRPVDPLLLMVPYE